jgi:hypothetical protein
MKAAAYRLYRPPEVLKIDDVEKTYTLDQIPTRIASSSPALYSLSSFSLILSL